MHHAIDHSCLDSLHTLRYTFDIIDYQEKALRSMQDTPHSYILRTGGCRIAPKAAVFLRDVIAFIALSSSNSRADQARKLMRILGLVLSSIGG